MAGAVCLCAFGRGLTFHGFPSHALLLGLLQVSQTLAFRCLPAEADLLHDFGELVLKGACGRVGPFAGPVSQAAADADPQAFRGGVDVPRNPDPGVLLCVSEFLLRGDVFGAVLFLQDEEIAPLALGCDNTCC
ncbi:hypothetical protein WKI68_12310 [Streptomyces sp. MS1.HAVA.3]|uniref:Secreted protein n=1 Tax=Streptomyces caledonius TaxID=3134107 RepID=A0ABU8U2D9_9ACTN